MLSIDTRSMVTRIRALTWLAVAWTLSVISLPRCASAGAAIPGDVVSVTVSDSSREYELRSVIVSADGSMTQLIVAAHPRAGQALSASLVWATVDASGRVSLVENPLAALSRESSPSGPGSGLGFVFVNGREFLVSSSAEGGTALVRLGRSNEPSVVHAVNVGGRSPVVNRVLAATNDHIILVGSVGLRPMVTEVDAEGKTITEFPLNAEGMSAVNAVFDAEGNVITACEQGTFPKATTWVRRVSRRGAVLAETSFAGRPTDLARGSDGSYLVLIERSDATGSEIVMKGLATDLSQRWTRSVASRQRPGNSFQVAPIPTGGFVVAGTKNRGLYISRITAAGAEVWAEAHDPMESPELEVASHVELASAQNNFAVAYTAFVVAGREQHQVVKLVRFRVQ